MAYSKTTWVNDSVPAINATNLNKIEQGIYDAQNKADSNETNIGDLTELETTSTTDLVSAINEVNTKDMITMYFTNFTSTGSLAVPSYSLASKTGTSLTYSTSGVTIPSGVTKILVSGFTFFNQGSSGNAAHIGIFKNGSVVESPFNTGIWGSITSANQNITLTFPPMVLTVTSGDVIAMAVRINGNTSAVIPRGAFTIEVVE